MNKNNHPVEDWSISVPLTSEILHIARQFAREQLIPEKAQQVYLNTLAVCTVNNYLRILGISTNLTAGDSWNSSVRLAEDVADLWVTGKGSLECRPIIRGDRSCYIPPLVGFERIGYVVVEIDEPGKQASLRGFAPNTVESGDLSLHNLHSLEYLPQYLYKLKALVNLSQWFKHIFETSWESIEAVLGNEAAEPAFAFRSKLKATNLKRCKLLELANQEQLALIVNIAPESDSIINILVELMPANNLIYLPENLQLILLDEQEQAIIDTKTKQYNQHIQLDLSGEPGERFTIKVVLGQESFSESFII